MKNIMLSLVMVLLTVSCRSEKMAEEKAPAIVVTDMDAVHKDQVVRKIKAALAENPDALKNASPKVLAIAKEAGLIR